MKEFKPEKYTRQQEIIASLGLNALKGKNHEQLVKEAARQVCEVLETTSCRITSNLPEQPALLPEVSLGWEQAKFNAKKNNFNTLENYTLSVKQPVITGNFYQETRFDSPSFSAETKLISALCVIIGDHNKPFGTFSIYSAAENTFTPDIVNFLQSIANILAEAIVRKQAEITIADSEAKFRMLMEQAADGIFIADKEGRYTDVNPSACQMLGYTREELLHLKITDLIPLEELPVKPPRLAELKNGNTLLTERKLVCKNGENIFLEMSSKMLSDGSFQAIARDITMRKSDENSLKISEELNRRIIEAMPGGIVLVKMDGSISKANKTAEEILGISFNESKNVYINDFEPATFHEDGTPFPVEEYPVAKCIMENKAQSDVTIGIQKPDGKMSWAIFRAIPIADPVTGKQTGAIVTFIDITERKKTEEQLSRRERELSDILENSPDIIIRYDKNLRYLFVNPAVARDNVRPVSYYIGKTNRELNMPLEKAIYLENIIKKVFETGKEIVEETDFDSQVGKLCYQITWLPEFSQDGTTVETVLSIAHNITTHKKIEQQLKASLQEKEMLLQEIHHRVKNNLQIISSLHSLQSARITNPEALEMLKDSQNRIKSMAYIHEKLYQSEDLAHIDFSDYIRNLAYNLFHTYKISAENITLELDINDVLLNIDIAIPCGMLINELITNSLKYAFPGNRKGKISINLSGEANELVLVVKDNGIGLPPRVALENTGTLGLQLVNMLAGQINAAISINRQDGTEFKIIIPQIQ
jgi:PAS domain S-box-containing protein